MSFARRSQASKLAALGHMSAGLSHELNQPLAAIRSYAGNARKFMERERYDTANSNLGLIVELTERMARIIRQLRTYARKEPTIVRPTPVVRAIEESLALLHRRIDDAGITVSVDVPDYDLTAIAGEVRLQQVLVNLISNALDAIAAAKPSSERQIRIAAREEQDAVVIRVADSGPGIPPENLPSVFDPFFTTKEVGQGTGLGLSTVYGIVAQAKGDIEVASEPGRGTSFRISLPRVDAAVEDDRGDLAEVPLPRGTETILVVEDDDQVRQVVVLVLHQCGYTVLHAANHQEALPLAEHYQGRIDLLVTDVVMPGMNGPELARRVRAVRPRIGVLYVSGHASDAMTSYGMDVAEVNLLRKPFAPTVLAKEVRRLLNRAGSDRPVA
jgi:two-component system cell cycle sensor histidine kinase/response regulator CckA